MLCQVFKSSRRQEMYLYVEKSVGLEKVPEALMRQFGEPEAVMMLMLDGKRTLARADAAEVLQGISEQGFYLQMPPAQVPPGARPTQ